VPEEIEAALLLAPAVDDEVAWEWGFNEDE
jgi:hypothetical protein